MRPLDYFYDSPASGPGHYPQHFQYFFSGLVKVVFSLFFRPKIYGLEQFAKLPEGSGAIISANHRSYLDPVFLFPAFRKHNIRFMTKQEFFEITPAITRMATWVGIFPIKRASADMESVKRAVRMLKRGEYVGIFPEGTRIRKPGQTVSYHEGVAMIAALAKVPVVPLRIWNTEQICPEGKRFFRCPRVTLAFDEPLNITDERFQSLAKEQRYKAFVDAVMEKVYSIQPPRKV
ncbi:MAG: 1-acyl-sn-glycerol-3-phosphate acyltransferase [Coriobacteriia bacterium]|nr:1-acyl-sn-glycerol-3-phosphate acyltransferase [Coriobacteriia bacterium]